MHFDVDIDGSLLDADFGNCKLGPLLQLIRERSIRLFPKEAPLPPNGEPVTRDWILEHGLECRQIGHPQIKLWALRAPKGTVVVCPELLRYENGVLPVQPFGTEKLVDYVAPEDGYAITDGKTPHGATCLGATWCENFLYVT